MKQVLQQRNSWDLSRQKKSLFPRDHFENLLITLFLSPTGKIYLHIGNALTAYIYFCLPISRKIFRILLIRLSRQNKQYKKKSEIILFFFFLHFISFSRGLTKLFNNFLKLKFIVKCFKKSITNWLCSRQIRVDSNVFFCKSIIKWLFTLV